MPQIHFPTFRRLKQLSIIIFLPLCSCSPRVLSLKALPCTTITAGDSVRLSWTTVHATPVMLLSQEDANDDENPGKHYLYYTLVARNGKKEASFPTLALTVLKDTSVNYIVTNTIRKGDSAVADVTLDTLEWGKRFIVNGICSTSNRNLSVGHGGRSVLLVAGGNMVATLNGLANSGMWHIGTALTSAEKMDSSLIPGKLTIKTIIVHH